MSRYRPGKLDNDNGKGTEGEITDQDTWHCKFFFRFCHMYLNKKQQQQKNQFICGSNMHGGMADLDMNMLDFGERNSIGRHGGPTQLVSGPSK